MLLVLSSAGARAAKGSNELTLPEQGDKIFDSSDYNVFRSISFVFYRHFSTCCSIRRLVF